jgi:hypothetical protein
MSTRVLLVGLPRMLSDLMAVEADGAHPTVEVRSVSAKDALKAVMAAPAHQPVVVICAQRPSGELVGPVQQIVDSRAWLPVVSIALGTGEATVYEPRPSPVAIEDLSPQVLLELARRLAERTQERH